jgi:hypothetical protein
MTTSPSKARKPPPPPRPHTLADNSKTMARLAELGAIQCTVAEAAQILGHAREHLDAFLTLHPRGRVAFEQGAAQALQRLRAAQFKLAETSPTMAIFLGKHYLGQADRRELESSAQVDQSNAAAAEAARSVRDRIAALIADRTAASGGGGGAGDAG